MLKFCNEQFAVLARRYLERRSATIQEQLATNFPKSFGSLPSVEQQSRLMTLQTLCKSLEFDYLRDSPRLFELLTTVDVKLAAQPDRLDFYAVLTDTGRDAATRLRMLEQRFLNTGKSRRIPPP